MYDFLALVRAAFDSSHLHFTLVTVALLGICIYFLIKRFLRFWDQWQRKRHPPSPFVPGLLTYYKNATYWWAFFTVVAFLFFGFALYLARYQNVGGGVEAVGLATHRGGLVSFTSFDGSQMTVPVNGDQVAAAGIFLRFPSWMRYLGLKTYHKTITFRGNSDSKYHYQKPEANFLASYVDPIFLFAYKNRKTILIADPYYTESVYFSGKRRVFVTHSGYILQK